MHGSYDCFLLIYILQHSSKSLMSRCEKAWVNNTDKAPVETQWIKNFPFFFFKKTYLNLVKLWSSFSQLFVSSADKNHWDSCPLFSVLYPGRYWPDLSVQKSSPRLFSKRLILFAFFFFFLTSFGTPCGTDLLQFKNMTISSHVPWYLSWMQMGKRRLFRQKHLFFFCFL